MEQSALRRSYINGATTLSHLQHRWTPNKAYVVAVGTSTKHMQQTALVPEQLCHHKWEEHHTWPSTGHLQISSA